MSDDQDERIRQKKAAQQAQGADNAIADRNRLRDHPIEAGRFSQEILLPAVCKVRDDLEPERRVIPEGYKAVRGGRALLSGDLKIFDPTAVRLMGRKAVPELTLNFAITASREDPDILWMQTTWKAGETRAIPLATLCGPLDSFTTDSIVHEVKEAWLAL